MFLLVGPIWWWVEKEIERESLNRSIGRADGSLFFVGANYHHFQRPQPRFSLNNTWNIQHISLKKDQKVQTKVRIAALLSTRPPLNNALAIAH